MLAAALGGPDPSQQDPSQSGPGADLAAALTGGDPSSPQSQSSAPSSPYGDDEQQATTHLQRAIQALQDYQDTEQDAEDVAAASQCESQLKKLLAKDQREAAAQASQNVTQGQGQ